MAWVKWKGQLDGAGMSFLQADRIMTYGDVWGAKVNDVIGEWGEEAAEFWAEEYLKALEDGDDSYAAFCAVMGGLAALADKENIGTTRALLGSVRDIAKGLQGLAKHKGAGILGGGRTAGGAKPPRFKGPKPQYSVNNAHVPGRGLRPGRTPLPSDARSVYSSAVPNSHVAPSAWFGRNADGQIYRFSPGNDGTVHFSGIIDPADTGSNLTLYARQRLGVD